MRETVLVIFGNPAAGTPVMAEGVVLPGPATLGPGHNLDADLEHRLAITPIADALVAP